MKILWYFQMIFQACMQVLEENFGKEEFTFSYFNSCLIDCQAIFLRRKVFHFREVPCLLFPRAAWPRAIMLTDVVHCENVETSFGSLGHRRAPEAETKML